MAYLVSYAHGRGDFTGFVWKDVHSFHLPGMEASVPVKNRNKRLCNLYWAHDRLSQAQPAVFDQAHFEGLSAREWKRFRGPLTDLALVASARLEDREIHVLRGTALQGESWPDPPLHLGMCLDPSRGTTLEEQVVGAGVWPSKRALYVALPLEHFVGGLFGPFAFDSYLKFNDAANG